MCPDLAQGFWKQEAVRFFTNWTIDEAAYDEQIAKDPNRAIFEF